MKKRVLVVPDAYWGADSGAAAARNAAILWSEIGCEVGVYVSGSVLPEQQRAEVQVFPRLPYRWSNHLVGGRELAHFEALLDQFRPSHVFFLGVALSKPATFFRACRGRGIRTMGFWWVQDFFCCRGYACLTDGPCRLCLGGSYLPALANRCSYREQFNRVRLLAHALSLRSLKKELLRCDVMFGSSLSQLELYRDFGVRQQSLVQCPLFFDRGRLAGLVSHRGDYFVCYGQARMEKGAHFIKGIMELCPDVKLVLPFDRSETAVKAVAYCGIDELVRSGRIEIRTDIIWHTGAGQLVADSRGVLIPTIWPSTTEYVLLESLGLGKPVVAFNVGIHGELLISGQNAMLSSVGDLAGMARSLELIAGDDRLAAVLEQGARVAYDRLTQPESLLCALETGLDLTS